MVHSTTATCYIMYIHISLLLTLTWLFPGPAMSETGQFGDNLILYIAPPLAAVAFICATAVFIVVIVNRRKKEFKLEVTPTAGCHEMTSISNGTDGTVALRRYVPREPPDGWEVDPTRINIVELLGEGFFGVVVKAEVLSRAVSSPTTRPQDIAYTVEGHRPRSVSTARALLSSTSFSSAFGGRKTLVAIKMLKGRIVYLSVLIFLFPVAVCTLHL